MGTIKVTVYRDGNGGLFRRSRFTETRVEMPPEETDDFFHELIPSSVDAVVKVGKYKREKKAEAGILKVIGPYVSQREYDGMEINVDIGFRDHLPGNPHLVRVK